jgi:predicted  nucleic acid-binding Zn-ribbon protein
MMNLDVLPQQLEAFVERARVALNHEITGAKEIVATATAEKERLMGALAELQGQLKQVQADLDRSREYLDRGQTLAGLDGEIAEDRKALDALKLEIATERKALEKAKKERGALQAQVIALRNEVADLSRERASNQDAMARLRQQLGVM